MKVIMKDKNYNFFNLHSIDILKEIDKYLIKNYISMQHRYFKILYLFLKSKDLFFKNIDISTPANEESLKQLITLLFSLFNKIYTNDEKTLDDLGKIEEAKKHRSANRPLHKISDFNNKVNF